MKKEFEFAARFSGMALPLVVVACLAGGCLSIKTEHEIKPIQITMDVNLKVQKELEDFLNLD